MTQKDYDGTILHLTLLTEILCDELIAQEEACESCVDCNNKMNKGVVNKAFDEANKIYSRLFKEKN